MKLQFREIEPFVKKPAAYAQAILVYGPDEGLMRERMTTLTKTVVEDVNDPFNVAHVTAAQLESNPARLLDEAKALSMLGGRRVVRVTGDAEKAVAAIKSALAALTEGDNLVLVEGGELSTRSALRLLFENAKNAAAVPCYADDARDLARLIGQSVREAGYSISEGALSQMAECVTGDRAVARGEVEKLITYMGAQKNISEADVSAAIGDGGALALDDLARHVGGGRFAEADRILTALFSEGVAAVAVLRALQNHFLRLHITRARIIKGENAEIAAKKLKPPVFWKHKADFESQLSFLSVAQMEQALTVIASAEARCKQTASLPETITGRAVLSLCQIAGRAAARRRA